MPARMPPRKASSQISQPGSAPEGMLSAIKSVASVPMRYCPGAPMLNRPVLNASATERPVMTSGVARKSILPMLAGLKPQVSAPFASRPVERMPMKIRRMPSHAPLREMLLLKMPTIRTTIAPTTRPIRMEMSEARTFCVLSFFQKLMPALLPSRCAWRRPYTGRAPVRWSSSDPARRRSRPHT